MYACIICALAVKMVMVVNGQNFGAAKIYSRMYMYVFSGCTTLMYIVA